MNVYHRYSTVELVTHAAREATGGPVPEFVDIAGPGADIGDPEGDFCLKLVGPTPLDAEDFASASPRLEEWVNANRPMHAIAPERTGRTMAIRAAFEGEAEALLAGDIESAHFSALAGRGIGHYGLSPRDVRDVVMGAISMHEACHSWDSTSVVAAIGRGIPNKTSPWPSLAGAAEIAARLDEEDRVEEAKARALAEAEAPADAVSCEDHGVVAITVRRTLNGTSAVPPELLDFPGQTSFVDRVQDAENYHFLYKRADLGYLPVPAQEIGWGINVQPLSADPPAPRHQVRETTRRITGACQEFFLKVLRPAVAPGPVEKTYDYRTADGHHRAELGESLTAALRLATLRGDYRAARLWLDIEVVGLSRAPDLVASEALAWARAQWDAMHPRPEGDGLSFDYESHKMIPWKAPRMPYPFGDTKELEREMGLVVSGQGRLVGIDECYSAPSQATIDRLALGMNSDELDVPIATFADREMFTTEDVVKVLVDGGHIAGKASPRMLARIKHSVERLGYRKTQKIVNGSRSWFFVRATEVAS